MERSQGGRGVTGLSVTMEHGKKISNTTLMNRFAAGGRKRDAGDAISSTEPSSVGTAEKGRHPVSKVNTLISSV